MVMSMAEPRKEMSSIELVRRIFWLIAEAERQLGIPCDEEKPLFERCKCVLAASQNGGLSPETYGHMWRITGLIKGTRFGTAWGGND